jgi:hypothetical protein
MEHPAAFRAEAIDDAVEPESEIVSLIQGIVYWGVLAIGFLVPLAGAIWGSTH